MTRDTYPRRYEVRSQQVTMRFETLTEARAGMVKMWRDLGGEHEVMIVDNQLCHVIDRLPVRRGE